MFREYSLLKFRWLIVWLFAKLFPPLWFANKRRSSKKVTAGEILLNWSIKVITPWLLLCSLPDDHAITFCLSSQQWESIYSKHIVSTLEILKIWDTFCATLLFPLRFSKLVTQLQYDISTSDFWICRCVQPYVDSLVEKIYVYRLKCHLYHCCEV